MIIENSFILTELFLVLIINIKIFIKFTLNKYMNK